jgi:hypothetical protein
MHDLLWFFHAISGAWLCILTCTLTQPVVTLQSIACVMVQLAYLARLVVFGDDAHADMLRNRNVGH